MPDKSLKSTNSKMEKSCSLSGSEINLRGGRYQYSEKHISILGFGSYGTVFRGRDKLSNQSVAIKKVETAKVKKEELEILQKLKSSYIVALLHIEDEAIEGFKSAFTFIVMELCDTDLSNHIKTSGPLNLQDFNTVMSNVALGYQELYRNQIVHRDIKPHNILICYKWANQDGVGPIQVAKLTDFGISRQASKSMLSNLAGTLLYMAPEIGANIVEEHAYDAQCDMWSIGVVLFECLAGEPPYDENDLCRLFLHATAGNGHSFKPPRLPEEAKVTATKKHQKLLDAMLQLQSAKRLKPIEFLATAIDIVRKTEPENLQKKPPMRTKSTSVLPKLPPNVMFKASLLPLERSV